MDMYSLGLQNAPNKTLKTRSYDRDTKFNYYDEVFKPVLSTVGIVSTKTRTPVGK